MIFTQSSLLPVPLLTPRIKQSLAISRVITELGVLTLTVRFIRERFDCSTQNPLRPLLHILSNQNYVIQLHIPVFLKPFLPLRKVREKFLYPTTPELVAHILDLSLASTRIAMFLIKKTTR